MSPPVLTAAKKAGFKEFADFESLDYKYPAVAIATTRSFIERQRATTLNFLRGEIEGIHVIKTQKSFAVNVLRKYMRISDPGTSKKDINMRCDLSSPGRSPNWRKPKRCWTS